ncbi:MAG: Ldh family oxidoreductase, partial [Pseudomonadota bacterium]
KSQGIAMGAVRNCFHFAALWRDVEPLAEAGLIGIACTCANAFVAPWGGATPLFGTNPLAFAWPRPDGMVVFDQASSAMARGEIMIAKREGRTVPMGTGVDKDGQQTMDPAAILAGAQLPFGGYKGSAIAMMIELLAGALVGENLSIEATTEDNKDGGPSRGGMFFVAIDPSKCGDIEGWQAHGEKLFNHMQAIDGVRLPGQRRLDIRAVQQNATHLSVDDAMLQAVRDLLSQ